MEAISNDQFKVINYVDCTIEQKKDIFDLRNDPDMRKWAADPKELLFEDHLQFIENLQGDEKRYYFAVYKDETLIGSYNLHQVSDTTWERGLFSSPSSQGKGLTTKWEHLILTSLPKSRFRTIVAEVKINNSRSLHYHEKMGFTETGRDNDYVYYKKEL